MISYASAGLLLGVLLTALGLLIGRRGRPPGAPAVIDPAPVEPAPRSPAPRSATPPETVETPGPRVETAVVRTRRPGMTNSRFGRGPGEPVRARARPAGSHRR